jgi:hypothetical protein
MKIYFKVCEFGNVVMCVVAGVKEAGVAFEEIGAELGGGE